MDLSNLIFLQYLGGANTKTCEIGIDTDKGSYVVAYTT
jgi:hypothetical protein